MNNFLNPDSFFWRWFGRLADALVLSLLWALCCLPVITIVPSCIALYDSIARCIHSQEDHPYKHFFLVLKAELLRGMGITLLWGVVGFFLMIGYNFLYQLGNTNQFAAIYSMVYLATMLIPLGIFAWLIPLEARFAHTFGSLHKTAATFAIVHLPTTGILLALPALAIVLILSIPALLPLLPGVVVTLQSWFIEKVFKKYLPQEDDSDDTTV